MGAHEQGVTSINIPDTWPALEELIRQNCHLGLDRAQKIILAFVAANPGWDDILAVDDRVQFARRALALIRWVSRFEHQRMRLGQLQAAGFRFWVYRSADEYHPCHADHAALDGLALPPDHPFWLRSFPPNDWGCGCSLYGARGAASIKAVGGDPAKTLPEDWATPDHRTGLPRHLKPGFDGQNFPDFPSCIAALLHGEHDRFGV